MNARIVFGAAGKYGSPRDSQKVWKIAPSAYWARGVLAEYAPSAIACQQGRQRPLEHRLRDNWQ